MGKQKHSKAIGFLHISCEALIHTIPKIWEKWIPIVSKKYGKTQEKSFKIHEWERYGYRHLFFMNWEKYSHSLGNLWKLVSHIWELCEFFNSIDFYSKPIVWEYVSFSHNTLIVWNFTLPRLCGLLQNTSEQLLLSITPSSEPNSMKELLCKPVK